MTFANPRVNAEGVLCHGYLEIRYLHQEALEKSKETIAAIGREYGDLCGRSYIDIMMNVGIVFYAAEQTKDEHLLRIAMEHSLTTRKVLVRGDGSTAHEGIFDLNTGEFPRQSTHQGWRADSSWARGLAWALYGFGTAYSFTHDARFLQTADMCADFYIERTPAHGIPPNDWNEPEPVLRYESSAAAIAASGMLNLSRHAGDVVRARLYRDYAARILRTLTTPEFLAAETPIRA